MVSPVRAALGRESDGADRPPPAIRSRCTSLDSTISDIRDSLYPPVRTAFLCPPSPLLITASYWANVFEVPVWTDVATMPASARAATRSKRTKSQPKPLCRETETGRYCAQQHASATAFNRAERAAHFGRVGDGRCIGHLTDREDDLGDAAELGDGVAVGLRGSRHPTEQGRPRRGRTHAVVDGRGRVMVQRLVAHRALRRSSATTMQDRMSDAVPE